jgi:hypothetical protein
MLIYNVTVKVETAIAAEWLQWLQEEHIPSMLSTGCFTKAHILRLLETDDSDGPTYAVQYHAESKAAYNLYIERFADNQRQAGIARWGNRFVAFRSLMAIVN